MEVTSRIRLEQIFSQSDRQPRGTIGTNEGQTAPTPPKQGCYKSDYAAYAAARLTLLSNASEIPSLYAKGYMKRLTYISKFSRSLTERDIENIGLVSARNNQLNNITGVLFCLAGIFFQILEGDEEPIDEVYQKILDDDRHVDILCLKLEADIEERLFPDWSMKTINLDDNNDLLIRPIKNLLQNVTESHRILEKYTQPTIFKIISQGLNPLDVRPRKVEKIVLFSDIVSFSTFAEKLPVEKVVFLVNHYLTVCSKIIAERGGEVTKFIGDCVMAYFDGDRADAAIQASLDILTDLQILRNVALEGSIMRVLHAGIGLSKGTVIEGNIGSAVKKDYTILGDTVNLASRLEALTRNFPSSLAFSLEVKNSSQEQWDFVKLGTVQPKGKTEAIEVYSVDSDIARKPSDGTQLARHISQYLDEIALD